jgi:hypothetical protein
MLIPFMFATHEEEYTSDGQVYTRLVSTPLVEDLFAAHPERAVLACVLFTGNQMEFYGHSDVWRVLHSANGFLGPLGDHCGDCTKVACSCERCRAEMAYEEAAEFAQDVGSRHSDALVLALATEDQCDGYAALGKWYDEHQTFAGFDTLDTSANARLIMWAALSEEKRAEAAKRAAQFRAWLVPPGNRLPPYPEDWPEHWDRR